MIWFVFALLASLIMLAALAPLRRAVQEEGSHAARHAGQLEELKRDAALGLVEAEEAQAVEREIKRRLLADSDRLDVEQSLSRRWRGAAPIVIGAAMLASVGVYLATGNPELVDAPPMAQTQPGPGQSGSGQAISPPGTPEEMVARLAARLEDSPDDPQGWAMLGGSYLQLQRFDEAVTALERAIELDDRPAILYSLLGQAHVFGAGGQVTEEAQTAFRNALERDPLDGRAAFFLAEAIYQSGDREGALQAFRELRDDPMTTPDFAALLEERIRLFEEDNGPASGEDAP